MPTSQVLSPCKHTLAVGTAVSVSRRIAKRQRRRDDTSGNRGRPRTLVPPIAKEREDQTIEILIF